MQLRDRKRINNIPRFNGGTEDVASSLNSMIGSNASSSVGNFNSSPLNSYNGSTNSPSFNAGLNMKGSGGGSQDSGSSFGIQTASSNAMAIGNAFSQKDKFTDGASNDVRNYGGVVTKGIPGKWGYAARTAVDLAADTIGMYNYRHNADEMLDEAGTSQQQINGTYYTTQNVADTASSYRDVKDTAFKNAVSGGFKGSAAGLVAGGPIGAIVGGVLGNVLGIFSGRSAMIRQKRINRNAAKQQEMTNQQQFAYADSQGLQNRYYANHRDTTGDLLVANRGKDKNVVLRKRIKNKTI